MKTMKWTNSQGKELELRGRCSTLMVERTIDADGDIVNVGKEPYTDAMLELWVDGKKADSCWNTNFWKLIDYPDAGDGVKKIWGLRVLVTQERALEIEAFLRGIIEDGKDDEVRQHIAEKEAAEIAGKVACANETLRQAETTFKKSDGNLMNNAEAEAWRYRYNEINNQGGEGYVPSVITEEQVARAREIIAEHQ